MDAEQELETLEAAFPDEVAAARALAEAQRAALAALPLDIEDEP